MKLVENGNKDEPVHMSWDASQTALASGAYDVHEGDKGERGPDQPAAQSPAPGTDPIDGPIPGSEDRPDAKGLTNITPVASPAQMSSGLPKEPPPPPKVDPPPAPKPAPSPAPKA